MKNSEILSVRLGDFIKELSDITEINEEDIEVNLDYLPSFIYGAHEKQDILNSNIPEKLSLNVNAEDISLYYTVIGDLKKPQADGKTLYDHTTVIQKYALQEKDLSWDKTYIIISKEEIKEIICNFDLCDLLNQKFYNPNIVKALVNASKKQKIKTLK